MKTYSFPLSLRYLLSARKGESLVLLLHGYQDNAPSMLKRLGWQDIDLPFQWLAVNAPFPVPVWNSDGFKEAYSWYFRDTSKDLVLAEPSVTAGRVAELIEDLNLSSRNIVIFGFSQGGYLAPFVAKNLKNVRGIVGLGCGYTDEGYTNLSPLPVYAVHGQNDERIDVRKARAEHDSLMVKGFTGSFHEIPEHGHKVDKSLEPLIQKLILQSLSESE